MTGWTAIIPINLGRDCKTRLAERLSRDARDQLVEAMARHVTGQVRAAAAIESIVVLSPAKPAFADVRWLEDLGRGLNNELAPAFESGRVVVIHADLPLLQTSELEALLLNADRCGAAIAPDRAGTGTNALALADPRPFTPSFGEGSFARHRLLLPTAAVIERPGLALDVDTPEDLDFAAALGALHRLPDIRRGQSPAI